MKYENEMLKDARAVFGGLNEELLEYSGTTN